MESCDGLTVVVMFLAVDDDEVFSFFSLLKIFYLFSKIYLKKKKIDETSVFDVGEEIHFGTLKCSSPDQLWNCRSSSPCFGNTSIVCSFLLFLSLSCFVVFFFFSFISLLSSHTPFFFFFSGGILQQTLECLLTIAHCNEGRAKLRNTSFSPPSPHTSPSPPACTPLSTLVSTLSQVENGTTQFLRQQLTLLLQD